MMTKEKFDFEHVAFFGRSIEEYVEMFDLELDDLKGKRLLDCSAGPAAFACQAANLGIEVVAVDPMYGATAEELRRVVDHDTEVVKLKSNDNRNLLYDEVVAPDERRKAMEIFLTDFNTGKASHRYVEGCLPNLPFPDATFDMALSSNFLFLYSDIASSGMLTTSKFDYEFHLKSIMELLRIARKELRIYPLRAPGAPEHAYLPKIMGALKEQGYLVVLQPVTQRDIKGAEEMLRIIRM